MDKEAHQKELGVITAATKLFNEIKIEPEQEGPIPKIVKNGTFEVEQSIYLENSSATLHFMIMKKYDISLADYLSQNTFSVKKVLHLAKEMVGAL